MKWTLLAAAALVLCCGLPFRTHETRTLLPVQTVQAERTEAGVRIVTEAGEGSGASYKEVSYEGYADGGVAVIVDVVTDNLNRTASEIRHLFDKFGKGQVR